MSKTCVLPLCVLCAIMGFIIGVAFHATFGMNVDRRVAAWEQLQQAQKQYLEVK